MIVVVKCCLFVCWLCEFWVWRILLGLVLVVWFTGCLGFRGFCW